MQSVAADDQAQKPEVAPDSSSKVGEPHLPVNQIRRRGQRVGDSLLQALNDPANWPKLKRQRIVVKMSGYSRAWLLKFQQEEGWSSLDQTLISRIENSRREATILPASPKLVMYDNRPVCIPGPSGIGKSLTLKQMLESNPPQIPPPILNVDPANEHKGIRISIGQFFEIKWAHAEENTVIRFVPSGNPDVSKGELRTIFSHLNLLKLEGHQPDKLPSGLLSRWTFVVEEGHRLAREPAFQNFLAEGRKFTRKIIVVASDPSLYGSICRLVKPRPLDELLANKVQAGSSQK